MKQKALRFVFSLALFFPALSSSWAADDTASKSDWLIDPSPFVSEVQIEEETGEILLSNGLVERIISIPKSRTPATTSLRALNSGEQFVRALGPEAFVTLDGVAYSIGGMMGQPVQNYFKPEWLGSMKPCENAYRLEGCSVEPIRERFPWKKRTEWLSRDLAWPPKGKHLIMRYTPPAPENNALEASALGSVCFEENFAGSLAEGWNVVLSAASDRTSISNEGKLGEIYALENTCAYLERAWPSDAVALRVSLDTGDDSVSNSWGPGWALLFDDRTISCVARPHSEQYEIALDGTKGAEKLLGAFERGKAIVLFARFVSGRIYISAEQDGVERPLLDAPVAGLPKRFRVGKVGKYGEGADSSHTGRELYRCHLWNVSCHARPDTARLREKIESEAQDLPLVEVHYEIYDGLPLLAKWVVVQNTTERNVRVDSFVAEELRLVEPNSTVDGKTDGTPFNLHVVSNYTFGGMADTMADSKAAKFLPDSSYRTQVNYQCQELALLRCAPEIGPGQTLTPGERFESFRIYELLHDSTDRERRGLAVRRMYRTLAPWTAENPLMFHKTTASPTEIRAAIEQCRETGFEMIIMSFGSRFNLESQDPVYRQTYKELADEARASGIALGGYSLTSSRRAATSKDNVQCDAPRFGVGPCLCSQWGIEYLQTLKSFMLEAEFGVFENDGPYPGDTCRADYHPGHEGVEDSVWNQWRAQSELYQFCREHGIYVNQPDGYFLNGGNKTGMGYRETNWSLPRAEQLIIERQNIYDGTWTKASSMGWMFVPLSQYHGGGAAATIEPLKDHLEHYDARFANLIGSGVQACYRGPRLFDAPETLEVVRKWVQFYKTHREVLDGDVIHLRRADGRDWDGWLNVNPGGREKGLAFFYNPLTQPVEREIEVPLYYTGLRESAMVSVDGANPFRVPLDEKSVARIKLKIPAEGYVWVLFE
ncbi:MAG: hypothetical protein Q4D38_08910 [Planctomycetia bacterium]|nr:hypothetical protein [Planctomycetia bacterium]